MISRGDVVLVSIPYVEGEGGKRRPVSVVQADFLNRSGRNTSVAAITSKLRHFNDPSAQLLDPSDSEGASAGVRARSFILCSR